MKKYSILFMAIATILFISCSKDDNDYGDGTWSTVEMTIDVTKAPMKIWAAGEGERMHTDWGDGSSSNSGAKDSHTYTAPGSYKIIVKVRNMKHSSVLYYYSSVHFKDCPNLELIISYSSGNLNDSLTIPKTIKFENCPNLRSICLYDQRITNLEIENCPQIKYLDCFDHRLSSFNLDIPLLEELNCSGGILKELDLSHFPVLKTLNCEYNQLTELDVSNNTELKSLKCRNNYDLKTIWVWEGFDIRNKDFRVPESVEYKTNK